MSDPFSLVYRALWDLAASQESFTSLVSLRSRISFGDNENHTPLKNVIASADLPEVILAPTGGICNLHSTTSSSMITKRFMWLISTGDYRIDAGCLFPVEFALIRAMCNWKSALTSLTWAGARFVKRCDMLEVSEGDSDPERNRGLKGWSAMWACEVEMHFSTALLLSGGTDGSSSSSS